MKNGARCLFGGALLAAGVAGQAEGSGFEFTEYNGGISYFFGLAVDASGAQVSHSGGATSAPGAYTSAIGSAYATTAMTSTRVHVSVSTGTDEQAYAITAGFITVESACHVLISWDFTNIIGDIGQTAYMRDRTSGIYFVNVNGPSTSGSEEAWLVPGDVYAVVLQLAREDRPEDGESGWATVEIIPAPGGAALMGVVVVSALRRRRRE